MITQQDAINAVLKIKDSREVLEKISYYKWGWIIQTKPKNDNVVYGHTYQYMIHNTGFIKNTGAVLWDNKLGFNCSVEELANAFLYDVSKHKQE